MSDTSIVEADVVWEGGMAFVARTDSHHFVTFDTLPKGGGQNSGPSPIEMLICALGSCTGMDVVTCLTRKRRTVEALNVHVSGKRRKEDPTVFEELNLHYRVRGHDLTEDDLRWAIELSINKYCSVLAMLSQTARVVPRWTLEPSDQDSRRNS